MIGLNKLLSLFAKNDQIAYKHYFNISNIGA